MYDLTQPRLQACLQLSFTRGLGNLTFGRLMQTFGSAEQALRSTAQEWKEAGATEKVFRAAQKAMDTSALKIIEKWLSQSNFHHIISYDDEMYPALLRELPDPPAVLYAVGNIGALKEPTIAIIGGRQATPLGLKTAQKFSYELSSKGLSICSGLALGIDAAAHLGALSAQGSTVAFMGTGVDVIYPKSNEKIAQKMIEENGLLVSELPLGTPPKGNNFPPRNRLICGLSAHGVLVVESKTQGGSMITARIANEQGKEVFAVPGSIQNPLAQGCHLLIQQGAKLVQSIEDILDELQPFSTIKEAVQHKESDSIADKNSISANHEKILIAMNYEIMRMEEIAKNTALPIHLLATALLELELQGKIQALSGNRWQRID